MAKISEPTELFAHKLGAALTMEETILEMLEELQEHANDPKLKDALRQHHGETQSCPTIEGLQKEGKQMLKEVEDELNDAVILSGVIETEHHEIAVYDGLIIQAEAMDEEDVRALLLENLESEEQTLDKAVKQSEKLSKELATA